MFIKVSFSCLVVWFERIYSLKIIRHENERENIKLLCTIHIPSIDIGERGEQKRGKRKSFNSFISASFQLFLCFHSSNVQYCKFELRGFFWERKKSLLHILWKFFLGTRSDSEVGRFLYSGFSFRFASGSSE
jgi:hypothetical protein